MRFCWRLPVVRSLGFRRRNLAVLGLGMLIGAVGLPQAAVSQGSPPTEAAARALVPQDVREKGSLVAGMPLDFEPFNFLDEKNDQVGVDVEIFRAIAAVLGLKPDIQRIGFAAIIPAVNGGRVDVGMSAMSILKTRLPQVSFVRYANAGNGLIVPKGNPKNVKTTEGCGLSIAGEKGTQPLFLWQDIAKQCETSGKAKVTILVFDGKGPQVLAVEAGRADAAAVTYATAVVASEHSAGKLELAPGGLIPGGTVDCGIAFGKNRPQLGQAIDAALEILVANGTYDRLFDKWHLGIEKSTPMIVQDTP
jgi:polar amino acid transport system substrate-binding protein